MGYLWIGSVGAGIIAYFLYRNKYWYPPARREYLKDKPGLVIFYRLDIIAVAVVFLPGLAVDIISRTHARTDLPEF
jgi:hypothetical protein